jgi:hypothetical protein
VNTFLAIDFNFLNCVLMANRSLIKLCHNDA